MGELSVLPFFSTSLIEELKKEYLSMAEDVDSAIDPIACTNTAYQSGLKFANT